jgi:hypothetical protein
MSMNTFVRVVYQHNSVWSRMKEAYEACNRAGIDIPPEVAAYFNHEPPRGDGPSETLDAVALKRYTEDMQEIFEVDLSKLDKDVEKIVFINSY